MQAVLGFRHRHDLQIITVSVVAQVGHVVVKLADEAGRCGPYFQQDVGIGGPWPARGIVLEEDMIGANTRDAGQHRAIDGVDVIAPHCRELVLDAQAQRVVAFGIGALSGDPLLVIVASREDTGHRFTEQVVIARGQIPGAAGELCLADHLGHRLAGGADHRLQGLHPVDGAVDALGGDPDIGRDGDRLARVHLDEVDHPTGLLGCFAGQVHIPGLEIEIGVGGGGRKGVGQHMARQQGADKPERRGDDHPAHQPPERAHIAVIGDEGAGGHHLLFELGLHGLLGSRDAGLGQQGHKVHVRAQVHRVTSSSPNS